MSDFVETNITKRWESGTPHHHKSKALFNALSKIDFEHGSDYFCWKSGGDGDNGEHLMYELDIYFEMDDLRVIAESNSEPSLAAKENIK